MTPQDTPALPSGLLPLYEEAVDIADRSPASAAALLRMLVRALVRQAGGTGRNLSKDIDQLVANGVSLMPEGLEKELSRQDLADIIAFVKSISK